MRWTASLLISLLLTPVLGFSAAPPLLQSALAESSQMTVHYHYANAATTPARLVPGSGFGGPTDQPQGDGPYTAIARWDVVPYQDVTEPMAVGVMAYHIDGIQEVRFTLEDGPWVSVTEATLNRRTGVVEYVVVFDPGTVPDGRVELRAIAFPHVGVPRVLEPLTLYANAQGLLPDLTVELDPSVQHTYPHHTELPPGDGRWVTIKGTGGLPITVVQGAKPWGARIRWQNATFITPDDGSNVVRANGEESAVWFEDCTFDGAGIEIPQVQVNGGIESYYDRCAAGSGGGVQVGFLNGHIVRDSNVLLAGEDGYKGCRLIINSRVSRIVKGQPIYHADAWQMGVGSSNTIVCGLYTRDSDVIVSGQTDLAMIDLVARRGDGELRAVSLQGQTRHALFKRSVVVGDLALRVSNGFTADGVLFTGVIVDEGELTPDIPGVRYE